MLTQQKICTSTCFPLVHNMGRCDYFQCPYLCNYITFDWQNNTTLFCWHSRLFFTFMHNMGRWVYFQYSYLPSFCTFDFQKKATLFCWHSIRYTYRLQYFFTFMRNMGIWGYSQSPYLDNCLTFYCQKAQSGVWSWPISIYYLRSY